MPGSHSYSYPKINSSVELGDSFSFGVNAALKEAGYISNLPMNPHTPDKLLFF